MPLQSFICCSGRWLASSASKEPILMIDNESSKQARSDTPTSCPSPRSGQRSETEAQQSLRVISPRPTNTTSQLPAWPDEPLHTFASSRQKASHGSSQNHVKFHGLSPVKISSLEAVRKGKKWRRTEKASFPPEEDEEKMSERFHDDSDAGLKFKMPFADSPSLSREKIELRHLQGTDDPDEQKIEQDHVGFGKNIRKSQSATSKLSFKKSPPKKYTFYDDDSSAPPSPVTIGQSEQEIRIHSSPQIPSAPGLYPTRKANRLDSSAIPIWRLSQQYKQVIDDMVTQNSTNDADTTGNTEERGSDVEQRSNKDKFSSTLPMPTRAPPQPRRVSDSQRCAERTKDISDDDTSEEIFQPCRTRIVSEDTAGRISDTQASTSEHESSSARSWASGPDRISLRSWRKQLDEDCRNNTISGDIRLPRKYTSSSLYSSQSSRRGLNDTTSNQGTKQETAHSQIDGASETRLTTRGRALAEISGNASSQSRQISSSDGNHDGLVVKQESSNQYLSQQDIDDLSQQVNARLPPRGRSWSQYDGNMEKASSTLFVEGTSPPRKPSFVVGDEPVGTSIWDKALQAHAIGDGRFSRRQTGLTLNHASKRGIDEQQNFHRKSSSMEPCGSKDKLYDQLDRFKLSARSETAIRDRLWGINTSTGPRSSAWARYPMQGRHERSNSPASRADKVESRDFASAAAMKPTQSARVKEPIRKSRSAYLERLKISIAEMYQSCSLEAANFLLPEARGHRSSISQAAAIEFPELELFSAGSDHETDQVCSSRAEHAININPEAFRGDVEPAKKEMAQRRAVSTKSLASIMTGSKPDSATSAEKWSLLYEDCVMRPDLLATNRRPLLRDAAPEHDTMPGAWN